MPLRKDSVTKVDSPHPKCISLQLSRNRIYCLKIDTVTAKSPLDTLSDVFQSMGYHSQITPGNCENLSFLSLTLTMHTGPLVATWACVLDTLSREIILIKLRTTSEKQSARRQQHEQHYLQRDTPPPNVDESVQTQVLSKSYCSGSHHVGCAFASLLAVRASHWKRRKARRKPGRTLKTRGTWAHSHILSEGFALAKVI